MSVTQEHPAGETTVLQQRGARWWIVAVVGVVALAAGVLVGSRFDGEEATSDVVTVEGAELTDRQQEMVELVRAYQAAWEDLDGDAAASLMTPNAQFSMPQEGDDRVTPADGSLQEFMAGLTAGPPAGIDEPVFVAGHAVVSTQQVPARGLRVVSVYGFDDLDGEILIKSHTDFIYLLEPEAR